MLFKRENKQYVKSLYFWKHMVNVWSFIAFIVFFLHFFSRGRYESADSLINIIYPTVLTIYSGQKEFMRWKEAKKFSSRFAGEYFVAAWTVVLVFFVIVSVVTRGAYQVTLEMVTTYLAVLSIYFITQQSKRLRLR